MKLSKYLVVWVILGLFGLGCSKSSPILSSQNLSSGQMNGTDKYVKVPIELIKEVESEYLKVFRKAKPENSQTDGEIIAQIPRRSVELTVKLVAEGAGILRGNAEFHLARGGGVLDLADWVTGVRGDFYWSAKVKLPESMQPKHLKVYFVSRAPTKNIEGEKWGMGCDKYSEITSFYHQTLSQLGWRLNSTQQRYIYAVSGTYLFVYTSPEELLVTSLSITDSRYKSQLCLL